MKDEELGDEIREIHADQCRLAPELPEGWEVKKVRQHFRLRSEKVSEQDYPWVEEFYWNGRGIVADL